MSEAVIGALIVLIQHLPQLIDDLAQKGELTAEQAAAFRQQMVDSFNSPAWQIPKDE